MALLNPGDEVLLFEPFYGYHANTLRSVKVTPVAVPMTVPAQMASGCWTWPRCGRRSRAKTRAMVVNTPSNPAGKVFTRAELEALARDCRGI